MPQLPRSADTCMRSASHLWVERLARRLGDDLPPESTITRSARRISSSRSEETSSTAHPRRRRDRSAGRYPARPRRPRPGSARRAAAAWGASTSHRPSSTFCWLPPDSVCIVASTLEVRISNSRSACAASRARPRGGRSACASSGRIAGRDVLRHAEVDEDPVAGRSSGTNETPLADRGAHQPPVPAAPDRRSRPFPAL